MKRKVICILITLSICIAVGGCSTNNKKTGAGYTEFGEKIATKEYLFKTYGFKESDLAGIDVDKVLYRFEVSEEALRESGDSKELVIENLKKLQKELDEEGKVQIKPSKPNYSYLVKAKKSRAKCPSFDTIKYFALDIAAGTGNDSYLIDFNQAIMYSNIAYPVAYEDFSKAKYTVKLSKNDINEIKEALKGYKVANWDYFYDGSSEVYEGFVWHLGMEFADGTIISKSGAGEASEGHPDNFFKLTNNFDGIIMKYKK